MVMVCYANSGRKPLNCSRSINFECATVAIRTMKASHSFTELTHVSVLARASLLSIFRPPTDFLSEQLKTFSLFFHISRSMGTLGPNKVARPGDSKAFSQKFAEVIFASRSH